ncbi:alpha/beta fold hydrolase [Amycolatopsis sp. NPDC051061]|uniref:S9 family peptidase n=1 Tax=Amycolatopsis sp. NPDC051061 TaxID=3155042 RepID=UPI003432E146
MTSTTQRPQVSARKADSLIPRDDLFGNPERATPSISPDGRWLAWLAPDDGVLNLWVRPLNTDTDTDDGARPVTTDRDRGIQQYEWAPDSDHLLYLRDEDGDENTHLYAVSVHTGDVRDLTPFDGVMALLVGQDAQITDRVLIALNKNRPELFDVYELDVATGELNQVLENPGFVGFVADSELHVRGALAPKPEGGLTILVLRGEQWCHLLTVDQPDVLSTEPVGFDRDSRRLLVKTSAGANAARLLWIDLDTGEQDIIAEDPVYDVHSVWTDPTTKQPLTVSIQRERLDTHAMSPEIRYDLDRLAAIDDGDLQVVSANRANSTWIVSYIHADDPTATYIYDRATGEATFLFHNRPRLAGRLSPVEPFSFPARDGLDIHGYLTFPKGRTENLPTVLLVHGGPPMRDTWELDPQAQWLADRGYLCIQVNFRGSTGYGKSFTAAGNREWGGKMQDDLVDAVEWAVQAGHADPDKVAIYGGSYGGYAALAGAAFTPDLFRCAIALCAPSNLQTLLASMPPHWGPMAAEFYASVGHPSETEFLRSRSPLFHAPT